jgi:hypothetical protein
MMMLVAVVLLVLVLVIALVVPDIMYCLGDENEDRSSQKLKLYQLLFTFAFR